VVGAHGAGLGVGPKAEGRTASSETGSPGIPSGARIWKMSGSGNDFVFFDGREAPDLVAQLRDPSRIRAICAPHTGVGADGVAILEPSETQDFRLTYFNRDGSLGELCGNASLCATRLAVELGAAQAAGLAFGTDAGVVSARLAEGLPEIDLQPPTGLRPDAGIERRPGELRMGFVDTGVPHLVVRVEDVEPVPLEERGPGLRSHATLRAGANVNWIAPGPDGTWVMRTFERGVEGETLACGTGAVACAVLLRAWGESGDEARIRTRSGRILRVRLRGSGEATVPSLAGEGRIVFEGRLREL
jgi:diaminopimelate epimerase